MTGPSSSQHVASGIVAAESVESVESVNVIDGTDFDSSFEEVMKERNRVSYEYSTPS
jgi:hypothetical protein